MNALQASRKIHGSLSAFVRAFRATRIVTNSLLNRSICTKTSQNGDGFLGKTNYRISGVNKCIVTPSVTVAKLDELLCLALVPFKNSTKISVPGSLTELPKWEIGTSDISSIIGYKPVLGSEIIGDQDLKDGPIIGYVPEIENTVSCSSLLKKRKQKMNKNKYKKRRKRDKFKRRNLENIKERKRKVKEKAEERDQERQAMA